MINTRIGCTHKNAVFGWSHTDYLGYCPDCKEEVTLEEVKRGTEKRSLDSFEFGETAYQEYLDWQKREAQSMGEIYGNQNN